MTPAFHDHPHHRVLGATLLAIGMFLNLTVIGLVAGMPLAIAGFALMTD